MFQCISSLLQRLHNLFCEGVNDDGDVVIEQRFANNPDADKKWRCSSKSNNDANDKHLRVNTNNVNTNCIILNQDVRHRVHVASEHGEGYDGNNPLQRPSLPLTLMPEEAEMQMAVNAFKLAGASTAGIIFLHITSKIDWQTCPCIK